MSGPPSAPVEAIDAVDAAEPLGGGEYVHVYRGRLTADGTAVRLLVLPPARAGADPVREAFVRRSEQWERLGTHPNVVTVRARGEAPRPWLAVEAVDGERLGAVGPALSTAAVRSVVADAAEALHHAARAGFNHGGLSPDQVRVCRRDASVDGRIDWGIERACRVAAGEAPTSPYTAPEQAEAPATATPAVDVYALGAVAYGAVTGTPPAGPVVGDGPAGERASRPPNTPDPALPPRLGDVLLRALAAGPSDRYATAYEFKLGILFDARGQSDSVGAGTTAVGRNTSDGSGATAGAGEPGADPADHSDWPTRRAALGVLGLAALGGGALAATRLAGESGDDTLSAGGRTEDSGDDSRSAEGRTAGTIAPPEAAFTFAFEDGTLTIVHDGGDSFEAGNLLIRSDDLDPSLRHFSDTPAYEPGGRVTAGDSLAIDADPPFRGMLVWRAGGRRVKIDGFEVVGQVEPDARVDVSFAVDYTQDGTLTVTHERGEAVPAGQLVFRGRGFPGAPERQWSEGSRSEPGTPVEPGSRRRFAVAEDVVVRLVRDAGDGGAGTGTWEGVLSEGGPELAVAEQRELLAAFRGPARPLDSDVGGAPTGGYDAANSGVSLAAAGPTGGATAEWLFSPAQSARPARVAFAFPSPSPAVADGVVYAGGASGILHAIDAVDATELWWFRSGAFSSATVAANTVYVGGDDLYALDPANGTQQWLFETDGGVSGAPRVVDGTVYVGAGSPFEWTISAVDAREGTELWHVDTQGGIVRPPAVVDSTVYVSADGVHALRVVDGTERWYRHTGTQPAGPAVVEGRVYVGEAGDDGENGFVAALDRTDGAKRWRRQVPGPVRASVAATPDTVYAAGSSDSGGFLVALDAADGATKWTRDLDGAVDSPPVVAGDTLYLVDRNGSVHGVDVSDGRDRWRYDTDDGLQGSPIAANGSLYVLGERATLYALTDPPVE